MTKFRIILLRHVSIRAMYAVYAALPKRAA